MSTPVDQYRAQQGLSPTVNGFHPDPQVLDWIVQAANETHADPVALLATALQESGGKLHGPAGDGGTSFSTFQFHIGGALGNHPPSWAATYPAFLNRAQEFSRLGVHGGKGAAAVQGPKDAALYAKGVDSLMDVARQILGKTHVPAGATPTVQTDTRSPGASPGASLTPIERLAGNDPAAQATFLNTILNPRSSVEDLLSLVQQTQVDSAPPGGFAVSPPGGGAPTPKPTPTTPLIPGGGWGGSKALARALAQIGIHDGLSISSEKRNRKMTASGGVSDHWVGSLGSYAYDLSNGSAPTPQMDKAATQIAAALGVPNWHGGVLNVNKAGYRYQVLYRTNVGGNHYNHVHVGVRKL